MTPEMLVKAAQWKMPFGRYKDRALIELPEPYLVWFSRKGFPEGELGALLALVLELKTNGLEHLLQPLKR